MPRCVVELRRDVNTLAGEIGPRNASHNYPQLLEAAHFLEESLRDASYDVVRQELAVSGRTVWNVEAERRGSVPHGADHHHGCPL